MDLSELTYSEKLNAAWNPNIPPETLAILARDDNSLVRCEVADNPNTPPKTLDLLAGDETNFVRYAVKYNPNTPQYIKDYLNARFFLGNYH